MFIFLVTPVIIRNTLARRTTGYGPAACLERVGWTPVQKDTDLAVLHMSFHRSYLCVFLQFYLYFFNSTHNLKQRGKTYHVIRSEIGPSVDVEFRERVGSLSRSIWQNMHSDLRRREICYGDQCHNKLHLLPRGNDEAGNWIRKCSLSSSWRKIYYW
jgi:hypothetical protein